MPGPYIDVEGFEHDVDESTSEFDIEALRSAFLAGFITGRTGRYYGEVSVVSKKAAESKFEQYYRNTFG